VSERDPAGHDPRRVAVVGGGVSGLTAAFRLTTTDPSLEVVVLEAADRIGGRLRSVDVGDLRLPAGPDSFLARKPWAVELCRELGIDGELQAPATSGSYLWTDHGLEPFPRDAPFGIPGDVGSVFRWPGLSRAGRRRAASDLIKGKRRDGDDETLGGLLRRRLGDEATDRAVAPLLGGLFAGDVDRLSVRATFPELARWEATQGSLIRGSQAATRDARRRGDPGPMFLRPAGGVERLTDVLAGRLGAVVRPGVRVRAIGRHDDGFLIHVTQGPALSVDAVIVATEGYVAADLLRAVAPAAAAEIAEIPYASTGAVLMVYADHTARDLPSGTGFVVPRGMAPMTAATWLSNKWPDPDFGSRAVVRCFVGAVGEEDILDAEDGDLIEACARFHAAVVPLPDRPEHAAVVRWPRSMPQYELGHVERIARIRAAIPDGVVVTGQAYDGVGIPDCVRAASGSAEALVARLRGVPDEKETVA
jgi:protoporphyrinogen/coproporphyrinogen III oxidase